MLSWEVAMRGRRALTALGTAAVTTVLAALINLGTADGASPWTWVGVGMLTLASAFLPELSHRLRPEDDAALSANRQPLRMKAEAHDKGTVVQAGRNIRWRGRR